MKPNSIDTLNQDRLTVTLFRILVLRFWSYFSRLFIYKGEFEWVVSKYSCIEIILVILPQHLLVFTVAMNLAIYNAMMTLGFVLTSNHVSELFCVFICRAQMLLWNDLIDQEFVTSPPNLYFLQIPTIYLWKVNLRHSSMCTTCSVICLSRKSSSAAKTAIMSNKSSFQSPDHILAAKLSLVLSFWNYFRQSINLLRDMPCYAGLFPLHYPRFSFWTLV
jgi:hypothetical protein